MIPRRLVIALAVATVVAGCGSTEPTVDPNTVSVVGTFQLASQDPVNPNGEGTYLRSLSTLTFSNGGSVAGTATITTAGFEMRDNYFVYAYRRGP
jgi:hypothetical protein